MSTHSKIFSRASIAFGAEPNTQACAVDLALPGTLPVMNKGAVERAIALGLALGSHIAERSVFARKNYFYPDLPKGYQISQFEIPVVQGGSVSFYLGDEKKTVRLVRAHLEEDAGKSLHDANVSVRKPGAPLGTRREIKNLNSFKFMQQAIDYEVRWQIEQLEDGHAIQQATVLFNPDTGETRAMRTKEDAADYRYFPDPDLPPLVISREWVERVRSDMAELPRVMAERFVAQYGLPEYDATTLTQSKAMAAYFEDVAKACGQAKLASNWIMGELSRRMNADDIDFVQAQKRVNAGQLAALINRITDNTLSNNAAKQVLDALWNESKPAVGDNMNDMAQAASVIDSIIEAKGLKQMNDTGALEAIIDEVLAAHPKNVEEYKAGNAKALNGLVGPIMKASKGKANPAQVNALLLKKLG
ncbi:MAG: aspartyl/glutamyl-tRNA amidotransferase subunit B [Betaproteobacteria bacterium]|nr:aspartyl/glutamyl-tRNA amidotransferase subunit B [Betaproteobacteria bacterium]